ncbi:MAG: alpha/beta hydrolase [Gammaproteobacteria bacterium]|nr:alpha/beta hydrolase [Gammaproteobacteria bacterium]
MRRVSQIAVLVLVLASVGTQQSDATIDSSVAPPAAPGTYIWVGQHRLHLNCIGEGLPTVIFDSGLGGSSLDWARVQPEVAAFTRACSYDRAGYGWSDTGPLPRDSKNISRELEILLDNGAVRAPYLLVGHSFGGLNVRLFTHNNPQKVAGLVLVDSSHEDQFRRFEEAGVKSSAPRGNSFYVGNAFQVPDALPDEVVSVAKSFAGSRSSMVAFLSELRHLRDSARQLRNAPQLPDVPVVVISHRIDELSGPDARATRDRIWMDMQSELASRAAQGRHVIAATEDHYIHLSQPQLVIESIRDVMERL